MITIIDYGMGNLGSIKNMLKKIGYDSLITSDIADIEKADKLILPGVGSFDNGIANLNELGLVSVLNKKILKDKTPILGICLGMQLLTKSSEEGKLPGLGWIDAVTVKFEFDKMKDKLKSPHMGWNTINIRRTEKIFKEMYDEARFYFVHSYYVKCNQEDDILSTTNYGFEFVSSFSKGNIMGVQFHPEKSHKYGFKLLKNFVEMS